MTFGTVLFPILVSVISLMPARNASAADDCRNTYGEHLPVPPPTTLKEALETRGKEKMDFVIDYAMKLLSSCSIIRGDPYNSWSRVRLAAMVVMDAVLPITVERTAASNDCESVLNYRNCALWVTYRIENMTDDMTFRSVAVSCVGTLQTPDNRRYLINPTLPVQYDPIAGGELGPHETVSFKMWFALGRLAQSLNYSPEQIAKYGGSEPCHVLAAIKK
jgi:hypothetical protein